MSPTTLNPRPLIGITADVAEVTGGEPGGLKTIRLRAVGAMTYAEAIAKAGGVPMLLPPIPSLARAHVAACAGIVMSGGNDPRTEVFGVPTHPHATPMHAQRQAYELALLAELDAVRERPVLGVCLGMQLMTLHAGGRLNQRLEETLSTHHEHVGDRQHLIQPCVNGLVKEGRGTSNHRQGVESAGALRVTATAHDGLIEAVDDPARPFYVGVQWHPERTPDPVLGAAIFEALVKAARGS